MSSSITVTTRGGRELALRFERFPAQAHDRLLERITGLTARLQSRVEAAAPHATGKLAGEIDERVYDDTRDRVAGYVLVSATDDPANEYAKAATLEYGTDKRRRRYSRTQTFVDRKGKTRRVVERMSRPAHIAAFRYLRGSIEGMRSEIEAQLQAAIDDAVRDGG